ncbi:MAG: IPT/TIG domain-containing protein, partial [Bacteroidota bacterium]
MALRTIAIALGFSLLSLACNKDEGDPVSPPSTANAPVISSVVPDSGFAGDTVTVAGSKFGAVRGSSGVKFGNTAAMVFITWSDSSIRLQVPANALTGNVVVTVGTVQSNGKAFKVRGTTA